MRIRTRRRIARTNFFLGFLSRCFSFTLDKYFFIIMNMSEFTTEELELIKFLKTEGYYDFRKVPNRGICSLRDFLFTTGIIIGLNINDYYGRYCYSNQSEASEQLKNWNGEGDPKGNWLKYKGIGGERENKNGGCLMCKSK